MSKNNASINLFSNNSSQEYDNLSPKTQNFISKYIKSLLSPHKKIGNHSKVRYNRRSTSLLPSFSLNSIEISYKVANQSPNTKRLIK